MNSSDRKDINIGMTFYGGVSLAVYEAGVAEEFIRFIQFCKEYKEEHRLPDVNVRVLSGASAGGLASVLMASTLVNSSDPTLLISEMRRIWFDVADISRLQYKPGQDVISFLNNDLLEKELDKFLQPPTKGNLCNDIRILLTATNMQGYFDAIPVEEDYSNKDAFAERAFPTLRHTEVFTFNKKDIEDARQNPETRKKIVKAGRITSSFPGAFPPQFFQSPSFPEATIKSIKKENPLHFWYFDGGVLDNKPLGHAIDHMESSRDNGDWWYFFVEPCPDDKMSHQDWTPDNCPDPVAAVMAVMEVKGAEIIYYDLQRLQKINHQVQQVNCLTKDLWEIIFDQSGGNVNDDYILKLEDNLKTARLHRHLPDYLKCVTMLFYNFSRKNTLEESRKGFLSNNHTANINNLCTLDLVEIIEECCRLVDTEELTLGIDQAEAGKMIDKIRNDEVVKEELDKYGKAVIAVKDKQWLFRQIAFWVEDDYTESRRKKEGVKEGVREDTWRSFEDAQKELNAAISTLKEAHTSVLEAIKKILNDDSLMRRVRLYVMLSESLHAAAGLQTRNQIKVVRIYHDKENNGRLAGNQLGNFGGFLDKTWRKNDYKVGMKDTREMLEGRLPGDIFTSHFWAKYDQWRVQTENDISREYQLDNVNIQEHELMLYNLPPSMLVPQIDGLLKTTKKLIGKYEDRPVYKQLQVVKVNLLLTIIRVFLWLIRHATAQPQNGKDVSKLADVTAGGRRYMGFACIGFVLGIVTAFFLPDVFKEWARILYPKIMEHKLLSVVIVILLILGVCLWRRYCRLKTKEKERREE